MNTIRLMIDLEYDDDAMHSADRDEDSQEWFINDVLYNDGNLLLHSDEIGDYVGKVKVVARTKLYS